MLDVKGSMYDRTKLPQTSGALKCLLCLKAKFGSEERIYASVTNSEAYLYKEKGSNPVPIQQNDSMKAASQTRSSQVLDM